MAAFTNQATLSYNNNVTNSNIVTGEILEELTATKTAAQNSYTGDGNITYVVNIVNSGTTDYTGLTITDNLGTYTVAAGTGTATPLSYVAGTLRYFINGVLQSNPSVTATATSLTVSGISIPAGSTVTLVYTVNTNEYAPLATDSEITNTATISGTGLATDVSATAVVEVDTEPNLTVTKSVNPTSVTGNGPLTYTFVISNTGNTEATATDSLILTDTFDPILNITNVALNGTALTATTDYTYNSTTGAFATTLGTITVPAATTTQDATTGVVTVTPGTSTLTVTGTIV